MKLPVLSIDFAINFLLMFLLLRIRIVLYWIYVIRIKSRERRKKNW